MDWMAAKESLVAVTGVSKDAWHILAGVGIMAVVALAFEKRLASPWPFLAVCVAAVANEMLDAQRAAPWEVLVDAHQADLAKDLVLTILLPMLLFLASRYAPRALLGADWPGDEVDPQSVDDAVLEDQPV